MALELKTLRTTVVSRRSVLSCSFIVIDSLDFNTNKKTQTCAIELGCLAIDNADVIPGYNFDQRGALRFVLIY